jgi:hypothetical protein
MSTFSNQQEPTREHRDDPASEIEAVAEQLIALVDEFKAALSEGHVPREFAERLDQLRQTAEGRLFRSSARAENGYRARQ